MPDQVAGRHVRAACEAWASCEEPTARTPDGRYAKREPSVGPQKKEKPKKGKKDKKKTAEAPEHEPIIESKEDDKDSDDGISGGGGGELIPLAALH